MKLTKTIIFFIFLIDTGTVWGQQNTQVTGYLLFSPWRTHQSFDLFFPAEIDSTKDLKHNLQYAKHDTARQVSQDGSFWDLSKIAMADTIKNEALDTSIVNYLEYCIVIPVIMTHNDKATELLYKNYPNELRSWPVRFFGKELFTFYNSKPSVYTNIRVIKLPKQSRLTLHCRYGGAKEFIQHFIKKLNFGSGLTLLIKLLNLQSTLYL